MPPVTASRAQLSFFGDVIVIGVLSIPNCPHAADSWLGPIGRSQTVTGQLLQDWLKPANESYRCLVNFEPLMVEQAIHPLRITITITITITSMKCEREKAEMRTLRLVGPKTT